MGTELQKHGGAMSLIVSILEVLASEYPESYTNAQLATCLSANEPSVRRATRELYLSGRIDATDLGSGFPLRYCAAV